MLNCGFLKKKFNWRACRKSI